MKILFLSRWLPFPPNNGSKLRIYQLLRGLAQVHEVDLVSFAEPAEIDGGKNGDEMQALHELCREVYLVPWKAYDATSRRARLGFFNPAPRWVVDTYSPEMEQRIWQCSERSSYDLVIASQTIMASYQAAFRGCPALFEEVEVGVFFQKYAQAAGWSRLRNGLTWAKHRSYLSRLLPAFQGATVVSEEEQRLVRDVRRTPAVRRTPTAAMPDRGDAGRLVEVIPNMVNLADYTETPKAVHSRRLIFSGSMSYFANYEAMVWFLGEVYPRVRAAIPDVQLYITGDSTLLTSGRISLPCMENITLTGFVEDVRPLIASASASLAPILIGGGTRLKILEAFALRTPVVATPKGAEGLEAQDGVHLSIAGSPEKFAGAVIRLLSDPAAGERLAGNAYRLVQEKYDWAVVMPRFLKLVEQVAYGATYA